MGLLSIFKRQQPNGRKPYEHRPTFTPMFALLPDSVREEYQSGQTLLDIANKHSTTSKVVRQKLSSLGVEIRPQGIHGRVKPDSRTKLSPEQIDWMMARDAENVPHAEIARHVNVTRERVRQICAANGCKTRRERQTKTLAIREAKEARKIERQKFVLAASDLWKSGASFVEMSAFLGNAKNGPNYLHGCSRVGHLRKHHQDLFPHRAPNQWRARGASAEDRFNRVKQLSADWIAGLSLPELAAKCGYKTTGSVASQVHQYRKKYPDLFPKRHSWSTRGKAKALHLSGHAPESDIGSGVSLPKSSPIPYVETNQKNLGAS